MKIRADRRDGCHIVDVKGGGDNTTRKEGGRKPSRRGVATLPKGMQAGWHAQKTQIQNLHDQANILPPISFGADCSNKRIVIMPCFTHAHARSRANSRAGKQYRSIPALPCRGTRCP